MSLKKLMVLTDFTEASTVAVEHCYQLASLNQAEIISLHVIQNNSDVEWSKTKTEKQLKEASNHDEGIKFKAIASMSSLYKGINSLMKEHQVELSFMATHGKKGMQFVTGSDALKVIFNAETPVLVVQRDTPLNPYKRIVMPMFGSQAEMDFSIKTLLNIARSYKSHVTFLYPVFKTDDETRHLLSSIDPIKDLFESNGLVFEIANIERPADQFAKAIMQYVNEEKNIDLVVLSMGLEVGKTEASKHKSLVQTILTNEENLPVLLF
jgi:nucleotide-binding universal stress UspA family protein